MNWVKKYKLPAIEAIQYRGQLYLELNDLQQALHLSFNLVQHHYINMDLLEKLPSKLIIRWKLFLEDKFKSAISKCNNKLTPGPDKLSWRHIKKIVQNEACFQNIINITNTYINLGHQLYHFKMSVTNFIQLVSPLVVDQFSQTKLHWKAQNEGYPHMCRMYKSDNK